MNCPLFFHPVTFLHHFSVSKSDKSPLDIFLGRPLKKIPKLADTDTKGEHYEKVQELF